MSQSRRISAWIFLLGFLALSPMLLPAAASAQEADIIRERFANANEAYRNKDYSRAYYWWNLLGEAGHAKAQSNLGLLYLRGHGVDKNTELALQWMEKAAQQGVSAAQYNLGYLYATLKGNLRDETKASFWYLKAAELGHPTARFHLAQRYERGLGTKRNYVEALRWAILAARVARSDKLKGRVASYRDRLLEKMPQTQIERATQLAETTKGN